jgi:hypothetical protein
MEKKSEKIVERIYHGWLFYLAVVVGFGVLIESANSLFESISYVGMGICCVILFETRPEKRGFYNIWFDNQ